MSTLKACPKPEKPWRSEAYRRWVASHACFDCGLRGFSQCAHSNQPEHGKGRGMKADDRFSFPLCCDRPGIEGCHSKHDRLVGMTLEERRNRELDHIKWMRHRAIEAGMWPGDK